VDHEGEVLEVSVSKRSNKRAALKFLRKLTKRHGKPEELVTGRLRSYGAALKKVGAEGRQDTENWANNRAENFHQPFRMRGRAMQGFRRMQSLQMFTAVHSSIWRCFRAVEAGGSCREFDG
jgi:putative transposase